MRGKSYAETLLHDNLFSAPWIDRPCLWKFVSIVFDREQLFELDVDIFGEVEIDAFAFVDEIEPLSSGLIDQLSDICRPERRDDELGRSL